MREGEFRPSSFDADSDTYEGRFTLDSEPRYVSRIVDALMAVSRDVGFRDHVGRRHVGISLEEAVMNAIFHGVFEVPSNRLRAVRVEVRDTGTADLLEERRKPSPYRDRMLHVQAQISRTAAKFVIKDEGKGFNTALVSKPNDNSYHHLASTRGLTLMGNLMDKMDFNEVGNEVVLTKYATQVR